MTPKFWGSFSKRLNYSLILSGTVVIIVFMTNFYSKDAWFSKQAVFYLLSLFMGSQLILKSFYGHANFPKWKVPVSIILAYMAIYSATRLAAGDFWFHYGLAQKSCCAVIALFVFHLLQEKRFNFSTFTVFLVALSALFSTMGLLTKIPVLSFLQMGNPVRFFGNVNLYSQFIGLCSMFGILLLSRRGLISRLVEAILLLNLAAIIFVGGSRSVIFFTLAGIFLAVILNYRKLAVSGVVLSIFIIIGSMLFMFDSNPAGMRRHRNAVSRFVKRDLDKESRFTIWKNTTSMIKSNPMGVGYKKFAFSYLGYDPKINLKNTNLLDHPHNDILYLLAEEGIVPAVFF